MMPPPMAVANPRMRMPRRSRFFRIALNAPDIANANVPTRSKSRNSDSWFIGVNFPHSRPDDNAPFAMLPPQRLTLASLPAYIPGWRCDHDGNQVYPESVAVQADGGRGGRPPPSGLRQPGDAPPRPLPAPGRFPLGRPL